MRSAGALSRIAALVPVLGATKNTVMNKNPNAFPAELRMFVDNAEWTYAKTMPEWPHEYIVRDRVDENLFEQLVRHIRANGFEEAFYQEIFIYFVDNGLRYWTMGDPIEETTIINRCSKDCSYESRLRSGTLPQAPTPAEQRRQDSLMKLPPEVRVRLAHRSAITTKAIKRFLDSASP